ncbi:hypothetical protein B0H11DRAFT_2019396 [Mycena galericulata]|nr:hypothetical protein B0H11DRAFT_2019396 [Mycena galericulata]
MPPSHLSTTLHPDVLTPAVTRARIDALSSEIAALYATIHRITAERETLQAHLDAYIYPVLTLPNELVSEIFIHSLPPSDSEESDSSALSSPLLLGRICRKWRDISLSTPRLWTDIDFTIGNRESSKVSINRLELLDTFFTRSRNCQLNISMTYHPFHPPTASGELAAGVAMEAVTQHCRRWEEAYLAVPLLHLTRATGDMPLLHTLTLCVTDIDELVLQGADPTAPVEMFEKAPKLKRLILVDFIPGIFTLPWAQLTTISIIRARFPLDIVEVLRASVNLTCFLADFEEACDDEAMDDILDIPPLLHLTDLHLGGETYCPSHMQLLEKLTLPALSSLSIHESCFVPNPIATVRNLISRSKCPLRHITVTEAEKPSRSYYTAWPSVDNVEVQPPDISSDSGSSSSLEDMDISDDGTQETLYNDEDADS